MMRITIILSLIAAICLTGPAGAEEPNIVYQDKEKLAFSESLIEPAPIVVWNRTITVLRATFEDSTPADRARRAIDRIQALPVRADWEILTTEATMKGVKGVLLGTKTVVLFGLMPGDLEPGSGKSLTDEAQAAADRLKSVLDEHEAQLRWSNLAWSIGLSFAATLFYVLMIWVVVRIKRAVLAKLELWLSQWRRRFSVVGINLVPVLIFLLRAGAKLSVLALLLALTYLWLTFCFGRFFLTQPWADRLGNYLVEFIGGIALAIINAAPGLFMVIVIFWLTRWAANGVSQFFKGVEKGTVSVTWLQPDSARASRRIVIAAIWIFALTIAYPYIPGSGSDAFKGVSVFAGLMLSLGATGFVNHIMSGLVIAYSGAMRVGDYVSVGDTEGTVQELGPMSTKIATPKKEYLTIPNGVVISAHVTNYSRLADRDGAVISTTITIGYDAPWRQIHALLIQAAKRTSGVRPSPAPHVLQRALSDFYVEYELRIHIESPVQRVPILSALHAQIQDAFNEAGVQIMSPHFEAQPENAVVVPKSQWYAPPAVSAGKEVPKE